MVLPTALTIYNAWRRGYLSNQMYTDLGAIYDVNRTVILVTANTASTILYSPIGDLVGGTNTVVSPSSPDKSLRILKVFLRLMSNPSSDGYVKLLFGSNAISGNILIYQNELDLSMYSYALYGDVGETLDIYSNYALTSGGFVMYFEE
jgi:hypothetical protein